MRKRIGILCGLGLWSVLMAQPLEPSVPIESVQDCWAPVPQEPVLVPPPKIRWRGEGNPFILPADQKVPIAMEDESYRLAAEALARELARYGLTATIALGEWQAARGIFLGGSRALQRQFPVPDRPGAYMLKVEPERVLLIGRFAEGVFYGVQTLMQLLQPAPNRLQIDPLTLIDYPDMLFRGVHLFGGTQPEFHRRLIGNLVGHLKFNKLVVECGYSQWDAIKPAWVEFSVPKANLREIVALAQAHYLEPIPLLQSLGHMSWVFRNNANVELAEDPETPWALCPRREASKRLLQRLFDEVLEIFPRRAFHLGLDEITLRGRFPYSPECQGATVAQLFSEHFRWLVGELQARGVQEVMLWSDMLLSREEAHDRPAHAADAAAARFTREQLLNAIREAARNEGQAPLLLRLCDWHYTPTEHYRSLEVLRRAGFQHLIATTWYNPRNIYTFAQAARQQRIDGLLQSTWAGYSLTEKSLRDAPEQFIAYVLAAIYAWNGNAPPPDQLPFDAEWFFYERYRREQLPLQPQSGFLVDLRPIYNLRLSELAPSLSAPLPTGRARLQGYLFQLADSPESPNALMLSSTQAPGEPSRYPREVVIPLAQRGQVQTLCLLHTTGWQAERNAEVARYVLEYADGTQAELPLLYGVHVRAWNDAGAAIESPPIWSQPTADGQRVRLRLLRWHNPHPDKAVRALRLSTTHPTAGYMLLGLSAIESNPHPR
jgi:hexosaminidase